MILSQIAAEARDLPRGNRCVPAARNVFPAPVAEMIPERGPSVEGVILRVATAPDPAQMINPGAPPQYGSARNLVVFTDDRYNNLQKGQIRPDGIRLLTFRPFW